MNQYNPVELAIKAVGGKAVALAEKLNLSHQAISRWQKNKEIPLRKVILVSEVTGIPKALLAPKFF